MKAANTRMTQRELRNVSAKDLGIVPANRLGGRFARTLEQLGAVCGDYGQAAVTRARWRAVGIWLVKADKPPLTHAHDVAWESVRLVEEESWAQSRLPNPDGKFPPVIIMRISPQSRREARRVARDTYRDWKRAGGPFLTAESITRAHQFTIACIKAANENNEI